MKSIRLFLILPTFLIIGMFFVVAGEPAAPPVKPEPGPAEKPVIPPAVKKRAANAAEQKKRAEDRRLRAEQRKKEMDAEQRLNAMLRQVQWKPAPAPASGTEPEPFEDAAKESVPASDPLEILNLLPDLMCEPGLPGVSGLVRRFPVPELGFAARLAVAKLTGRYFPPGGKFGEADRWWAGKRSLGREKLLDEEAARLLEAAKTENINALRAAAYAMQFVNRPTVVAKLRELLTHKDLNVRHRALNSLMVLGAKEVLADIAKEEFTSYRAPIGTTAILAIGKIGGKEKIGELKKFLDNMSAAKRVAAAKALLDLGDRSGVDALKTVVKHKNEKNGLRVWALRTLAETRDESLIDFFNKQLGKQDDFSFREVGHAIELVLLKTLGFYDKNAFVPQYSELDKESEEKRRLDIINEWKKEWDDKKSVKRVRRLVEESLDDVHWAFRALAHRELEKISGRKVAYDPFAEPVRRYEQIRLWKDWLRESGD